MVSREERNPLITEPQMNYHGRLTSGRADGHEYSNPFPVLLYKHLMILTSPLLSIQMCLKKSGYCDYSCNILLELLNSES